MAEKWKVYADAEKDDTSIHVMVDKPGPPAWEDVLATFPWNDDGKRQAHLMAAAPKLYKELRHLVRLLAPLEEDGSHNVPGLATLNGARKALAAALPESREGEE